MALTYNAEYVLTEPYAMNNPPGGVHLRLGDRVRVIRPADQKGTALVERISDGLRQYIPESALPVSTAPKDSDD